jgi:hypothetical protein
LGLWRASVENVAVNPDDDVVVVSVPARRRETKAVRRPWSTGFDGLPRIGIDAPRALEDRRPRATSSDVVS